MNNISQTARECNRTEEDKDHYATMLKKIWYQPKGWRGYMMSSEAKTILGKEDP